MSAKLANSVSLGTGHHEDIDMRLSIDRFIRHKQALALALLLPASMAHADTWFPRNGGAAGSAGDHLGSSIAMSTTGIGGPTAEAANRVYVGLPYASDGTLAECGSVQVYVRDPASSYGWKYSATLYAKVRQAGAHFGASLAADSQHLIVGAPDFDANGGAIADAGRIEFYQVYGQDTPLNIIYGGGIGEFESGANFGNALAVQGGKLAVAKVHSQNGNGCVLGYIFNTTSQQWELPPGISTYACGSTGAELGASVAIQSTGTSSFLLVAGAPGETQNGNLLAGAAHVLFPNPNAATGQDWLEVGTLAADNPGAFEFFGTSVGIDNSFVYVGATGRDNGVGRVGSVTIFKPASIIGYDYLSEYFPGAPATIGGHCGASLSVDAKNSQFIVGCPDSDGVQSKEGNARLYKMFTFLGQPVWLESLLGYGNTFHSGGDSLGASVALFDKEAFVGAPNFHFSGQSGNGTWKAFLPDKIFADGFGP